MEFHVVDAPQAFPSTCVFCSSHAGPVVHAQVERDGYGVVYVCVKCSAGIARAFGFVDAETYQELADDLAVSRDFLNAAAARIAELEAQVAEFEAANDGKLDEYHDRVLDTIREEMRKRGGRPAKNERVAS